MIRLFQNKSTTKGFAYIDAWISKYLKQLTTDEKLNTENFGYILKLIYLICNSASDNKQKDYTQFLKRYFGTHESSGLGHRSMLGQVIYGKEALILKKADNEGIPELEKEQVIKAAQSLSEGTWTSEDFDEGLKFLVWNAWQQESQKERRSMLAQLHYGMDIILENQGELDPNRVPSNIFFMFRLPRKMDSVENFVLHRFEEFNGKPADELEMEALTWVIGQADELINEDTDGTQTKDQHLFFKFITNLKDDISYDPGYYEKLAEPVIGWLLEELSFAYFSWWSDDDEKEAWEDGEYLASMELLREMQRTLFKAPNVAPSRLYTYLDRYVIGQDRAKKILSTAIYGHMKRIRHRREKFLPDAVLLVGPSGCGKTELVRHLIDATMLPAVITDVSGMNGSQYTGGLHREDLLIDLLNKAGGDLEKAENGIIFMDEFDKILIPSFDKNGINIHDEVQSQLLTVIEGSEIEITYREKRVLFDTSRLLFILAGAFQGIEEYIRESSFKSQKAAGTIGFEAALNKEVPARIDNKSVSIDVLLSYGMKREFAGRIGSIAVLDGLSRDDMKRILTQPKGCILERFQDEFNALCGGKLELEGDVLEKIVDTAMSYNVGARGLSIALRKMLTPIMYEAPDHRGDRGVKVSLCEGKLRTEWIGPIQEVSL